MRENIKERLQAYLKEKRINNSEFGRMIGVSNAYISSMRKAPSPEVISQLSTKFPDLNIGWLITGEGSMLNPVEPQESNTYVVRDASLDYNSAQGVPFFDTEAASCGQLAGFGTALEANNPSDIIIVPGMRAQEGDFFIRTRGRSMIDTLHPEHSIPEGALVLVRQWHADYIQWGEIYCVATPEGYAIKRLMPSPDPDKVTLQSADQMLYPPYEIEKTTILALGRVIAVLTYKDI